MKPNRRDVHAKYNGHCAYCGIAMDIKDMQVDHMIPQWRCESKQYNAPVEQVHCPENYMPACRSCNNYKSGNSIEAFRTAIENQITVLRRDRPTFRLAEKYGLIECNRKPIKFYFEK